MWLMFKKFVCTILLCALSIYVFSIPCANAEPLSAYEQSLWEKIVSKYLQDDLWLEDEAYDACHALMVPMHVAFMLNDTNRIKEFDRHIERFINVYKQGSQWKGEKIVKGRLNKLHYFYLLSEYVKLSAAHNRDSSQIRMLADVIYEYIDRVWLKENAWQWRKKEGFRNMRERLLWKLSQKSTRPTYLKAIIDEELFTFAIAADLKLYYEDKTRQDISLLNDILNIAYMVFKNEGSFDSQGRWLMQRGVWTDHPDYLYAAYSESRPDLKPTPIKDIVGDTNHAHRFPLIFNSLKDAGDIEQATLYASILKGLNKQFFEVVVIKPSSAFPYYRTTNYMNGLNGLHRYGYKTMPAGMGPYELSGTLTLGWWGFLRSEESHAMYKYMAEHKLPENAVKLYVGANTTRRRNPLVTWPDFLNNGFAQLIVSLANRL